MRALRNRIDLLSEDIAKTQSASREARDALRPLRHYYLGDPDEAAKRIAAVSAQGKAKA